MKSFLILGATGATGKLLCQQLLDRGHRVQAIIRSSARLPETLKSHPNFTFTEGTILDMDEARAAEIVSSIDGVASCLGHNITWKGIYGKPRRLVRDSVISACDAIRSANPSLPVRFVLMNTSGNANRDLNEHIPLMQRLVVGILRHVLPPHADNEEAADYLRVNIGQKDNAVKWCAVRPDSLINSNEVTPYEIHPSPLSDVILNPGKTSRINVANFMASLLTDEEAWNKWKGQMPVIYNKL